MLTPDAELDSVADEFIRGYLAARPLHATALGFHEYDGRISEYTRLAIDAELARLKRFEERLKKFDVAKLGPRAAIDLRLLQTVIKREIFFTQDLAIYERNFIDGRDPTFCGVTLSDALRVAKNFRMSDHSRAG